MECSPMYTEETIQIKKEMLWDDVIQNYAGEIEAIARPKNGSAQSDFLQYVSPSLEIISVDPDFEYNSSPTTYMDNEDAEMDSSDDYESEDSSGSGSSRNSVLGQQRPHLLSESESTYGALSAIAINQDFDQLATSEIHATDLSLDTPALDAFMDLLPQQAKEEKDSSFSLSPNSSIVDAGMLFSNSFTLDICNLDEGPDSHNKSFENFVSEIGSTNFDLTSYITGDDYTVIPTDSNDIELPDDNNVAEFKEERPDSPVQPSSVAIKTEIDLNVHGANEAQVVANDAKVGANNANISEKPRSAASTARAAISSCARDDDDEEIIDIETVEYNASMTQQQPPQVHQRTDNLFAVEDDQSADPTWCPSPPSKSIRPKSRKTKTKPAKTKVPAVRSKKQKLSPQSDHSYSSPSKKSVPEHRSEEITIPKLAYGRGAGGKNISICMRPNSEEDEEEDDDNDDETPQEVSTQPDQMEACLDVTNTTQSLQIKEEICDEAATTNSVPSSASGPSSADEQSCKPNEVKVKRKLNLQEYLKRREQKMNTVDDVEPAKTTSIQVPSQPMQPEIQKSAIASISGRQPTPAQSIPAQLKKNENELIDPILAAKNKVLRMKELKKAAHSRLIDSTVSAKTGPVTKMLPLAEMMPGKYNSDSPQMGKHYRIPRQLDYEEITIVSIGCNTDVSIKPTENIQDAAVMDTLKRANGATKISSSSLISAIHDVVLKNHVAPQVSGVPLHQRSPNAAVLAAVSGLSPAKPENAACPEHGEDKVIMHLPKDRVRCQTRTTAMETEALPEFPPLQRLVKSRADKKRLLHNDHREHYNSKRHCDRHPDDTNMRRERHSSSSSSASSAYSVDVRRSHYYSTSRSSSSSSISSERFNDRRDRSTSNGRQYREQSRRRNYSNSSSTSYDYSMGRMHPDSNSRQYSYLNEHNYWQNCSAHQSSASSSSSSSVSVHSRSSSVSTSRSTHRSRSRSSNPHQNAQQYRPNLPKYQQYRPSSRDGRMSDGRMSHHNDMAPVEERRIVYVGRLEPHLSKEMLRRKFVEYGRVKQVTLHSKENGLRYGFVTFERAQDAYRAIDEGAQTPSLAQYDVSFGGRRAFCRSSYADLDGLAMRKGYQEEAPYYHPDEGYTAPKKSVDAEDSFEALLQKFKDKVKGGNPSGAALEA